MEQSGQDPATDPEPQEEPTERSAAESEPEVDAEAGVHAEAGADAEGEGGPDGAEAAGAPEGRRGRRRRVLAWVGGVLAVLLVAVVGGVFYLYEDLQGNVTHENVEGRLGPNRPVKLNKSMNVLVMGSDSRAGEGGKYGDVAGARSDTTILLHISPNGDRAVGISFPRDSMVQIPSCKLKSGKTIPASFGMLNAAFAYGGPVCTWETIESLTGVHIDHFVEVDFAGFKRVVDALGGVEICVPKAINDPRANLSLSAGRQVVKGEAALGWVRERYDIGDGSDLERIQRQQKFMASVVSKVLSQNTLTDPVRLYKVLNAITRSVTTDDKLSLSVMEKLAGSLKGMTTGKVQFVTVPTHAYPKDPNRVQWDSAASKALFTAIREDNNLPAPPPAPTASAQPEAPQVKVVVKAATKQAAQTVVTQLKAKGFTASQITVAVGTGPTRISYGVGAGQHAAALAGLLPDVNPLADPGTPPGTVTLQVGPGGLTYAPPAAPAPSVPPVAGGINAGQNLCKS